MLGQMPLCYFAHRATRRFSVAPSHCRTVGNCSCRSLRGRSGALQKLAVDVTITGTSAEKVEIDFDGVDMGMGLNRPVLNRNGQSYSGQAILPYVSPVP